MREMPSRARTAFSTVRTQFTQRIPLTEKMACEPPPSSQRAWDIETAGFAEAFNFGLASGLVNWPSRRTDAPLALHPAMIRTIPAAPSRSSPGPQAQVLSLIHISEP